ncbi:hypothetical protein SAMN05445060_4213 [Williamsia sterculiae]|uniref:Uncharacterized protein n=1 Tax=Williamsia sterculiae TaxID=1344003 RepID=A0A1N7HGF1_9NOCA|nr:hypothetical protein SAMN05445060_4213 [Williamsia sterculiae]
MAGLSLADIDRWNAGDIGAVFGLCTSVSDHCSDTATSMGSLDAFKDWNGDAAELAQDSVHRTCRDLSSNAELARKVGEAARNAEGEVTAIKRRVAELRDEAAANGLIIDPQSDTVSDPHPPVMRGWSQSDKEAYRNEIVGLQFRVNAVIVAASKADHDLASAIDLADGEDVDPWWKPTPDELTLGGVAAGTSAKTDLVRGIWSAAMGEHPTGVDARIAPWLRELGESKGLRGISKVGGAVGVLTAIPAVVADVGEGDSVPEAVTREGAGLVAGMVAGGEAGAAIGGWAGTVVPGAGNVIGIGAGAIIGGLVGLGTSKAIGHLWN